MGTIMKRILGRNKFGRKRGRWRDSESLFIDRNGLSEDVIGRQRYSKC